ncbi:MAG: hypothetical protein M1840_005059 [Geoglossum simile]|nr:MAG: hypothetical protein M1840_005059 [Geoglossum simile]
MPPSTPARFKQSRLPFAADPPPAQPVPARVTPGKDTTGSMNTLADGGFNDSSTTPVKSSNVAVVIYTPNKTHIIQDGLSHLLTPSQNTHTQSQTAPAPHWRQTKNQKDLTPVQQPTSKGGGVRRAPLRNCNSTKESGRTSMTDPSRPGDGPDPMDMSSKHDDPEKPSLHSRTSTSSSVADESAEEYGEPESPSRNRRFVNPRSFLAGGASGNPPLSSPRPLVPKGSSLSGDRAAQRRSERYLGKRRADALVAPSTLRSTRSGAGVEEPIATEEVDRVGASVARKDSRGLRGLPAQREHIGVASTIKSGKRPMEQEEVDEDEDVIIVRGKRRRAQLGGSSSSPGRERDDRGEGEEEGQEDRDEEGALAGPRTRNRGGAVKPRMTRKQKLLEELKSRRAGLSSAKDANLSSSSEAPGVPKRGIYDTETENGSDFPDDEEDDTSGIEAIRKSLRGGRDKGYDTDFVVSDDDGNIGAPSFGPGRLDIPIEFTHHAHKKLKDHFLDAVEWMVHNKLNPAFDRNNPVYRVAFQRLNLEAAAYSSSKFQSSAWIQDFTRALKARPEFSKQSITSSGDNCEACNRKGHPATYKVRFSGKPYHHESLEDVSSPSEADSEDDGNPGNEYDNQGNPLPDTNKTYSVGRVCCLNAEAAHALTHWRYHLNEWVVDELRRRELFDANAILDRESWNTKKRSAYANSIMQQLRESGETSRLYRDFKNNLDEARNAKPNRW